MRSVEASVELDRKTGVKKIYHHAPGKPEHKKFIKEEAMTESDYAKLPLEDLPPEKPKAEKKSKAKKKTVVEPAAESPEEIAGTEPQE